MASVIDVLQQDHHQFRTVLDALDVQAGRLRDGRTIDFDLLTTAVEYLHDYAQQVHHPVEERMLSMLQLSKEADVALLADLEHQHGQLEVRMQQLAQALGEMRDDQIAPRRPLVDALRELAKDLRAHIDWEEQVLFPGIAGYRDELAAEPTEGGGLQYRELPLRPLDPRFDNLLHHLTHAA